METRIKLIPDMQPVPLHSNQREIEILKELRLAGGSCRIGYLAARLGVSDETIRRNIKALQASSQVRKTHGGVMLNEDMSLIEMPFQARMDRNAAAKRQIAVKFAEMIKDGDSLFLDIGSTTAYAAQALQNHQELYVVTNSLAVATALAARNNNRVFFAGGELRQHDGGAFGGDALAFIQRFNVQFAVFSVGAVNADSGITLHDISEADLAKQAADIAQTRIILADSSKFGHRAPISVSGQAMLDILITEQDPPAAISDMLKTNDIALVLA